MDDDLMLIGQYDGCNDSVISSDNDDQPANKIPVRTSNRQDPPPKAKVRVRNLKTVTRSNKSLQALELPSADRRRHIRATAFD